jgi:hypothetical protein
VRAAERTAASVLPGFGSLGKGAGQGPEIRRTDE